MAMATYRVNRAGGATAKSLIDAHQYVRRSRWADVQSSAQDQNAFLASHTWDEYGEWHLAVNVNAKPNTKARYAFGFGDFRRIHRMGIIACLYRAAEWQHKEVELAAHRLLQYLDKRL
jgi:hypothetical protein